MDMFSNFSGFVSLQFEINVFWIRFQILAFSCLFLSFPC